MAQQPFYKGDEIKFAISLEAPGFSMDDDDFDIEVKSGSTSVKGYKGETSQDLVIFKETDSSSSSSEEESGTWYAIVDTKNLAVGKMRVIATAHIQDANANDGVRDSIAVSSLGQLMEP